MFKDESELATIPEIERLMCYGHERKHFLKVSIKIECLISLTDNTAHQNSIQEQGTHSQIINHS